MESSAWLHSRAPLSLSKVEQYFDSDSLQDVFVHALARDYVLPTKEIFECFELFARIRKKTRRADMADFCCGHGLLGILFAMFEKSVERVVLIDRTEPPSRQKLIACATAIAPWVEAKIENRAEKISLGDERIPMGAGVVSAHACGSLSDLCIDIAIEKAGPVAILPCCYPKRACEAPQALQMVFGMEAAYDIHRTYRLENARYNVQWAAIPPQISPMNRVLCGTKK